MSQKSSYFTHVREKKAIALIHVREKKPIALIHGREKKSWHTSMGGKRVFSWMYRPEGCNRSGAWGLEKRWNKHAKSKREIVSSLILDKGKKTVSYLWHYILLPYREEEIVSSYIKKSNKIHKYTFNLLPLKSGNFKKKTVFLGHLNSD